MGKPVLRVLRSDVSEIRKLLTQDESYMVGVRLYMVYLVALGHSSRKLSEIHNVSFKQITNWVHRFEKEGIDGLKDRKGRGRHSLLSSKQLSEIKLQIAGQKPNELGLPGEKWTGPVLSEWIKNKYGVEYKKAQLYNILKEMGMNFEKKQGFVRI